MRLKPGDTAPPFQATDLEGRLIALSDFRGKNLLLAFFRYASCPLCNLRINTLIQHHDALQVLGLDIVAVFQSPPDRLRQYAGRQQPPFALVPDPDDNLYRPYGVESSWGGFIKGSMRIGRLASAAAKGFFPGPMNGDKTRLPADFLIGSDLNVQTAYYGNDIGDHLPLRAVRQRLNQTPLDRKTVLNETNPR